MNTSHIILNNTGVRGNGWEAYHVLDFDGSGSIVSPLTMMWVYNDVRDEFQQK